MSESINNLQLTDEFNPETIEVVLEELGISARELSEKIGFKFRNQLTKIKKGNRPISGNELIRLCRISNKPIEFFAKNV